MRIPGTRNRKMSQGVKDPRRASETLVEGLAQDPPHGRTRSLIEGPKDPCGIIIVGASGDLTARKLMPALFHLYAQGGLPEPFFIIGCSRTGMNDEAFREKMKEALLSGGDPDGARWERFASSLFYQTIEYGDRRSYEDLAASLRRLDVERGTRGNRIFYLAIPPDLYEPTARMLGQAGLAAEGKDGLGWSRVVVEKPFGRDLETAVALDRSLHGHFQERQIYRIDHYLAKETVQNILMFRFANAIFEPIWNRRYIDYVSITAAESLGVEHRAGYYEDAGVLRDMFQNHMMQLLALTAMEPPSLFEADRVLDEKAKLYRSLRPFPVDAIGDYLVLGQYDRGTINGKEVPAYREEPDVSPGSLTPTYAMMKVFVDNWRWQGVRFFVSSGKRLARKVTEITIQFREIPHSMFRRVLGEEISSNRLILGIYPDEKITLTFQTKSPGPRVSLRPVTMDFQYNQGYEGPSLDAYEKVLLDVMLGDHMLFWRQDGVELCWSFLTPILAGCESCRDREERLLAYEAGSWGPAARSRLG